MAETDRTQGAFITVLPPLERFFMKTLPSNNPSTLRKILLLTVLAVGGALVTTAAEAGNRVSLSIGIHGAYGGLYYHGGGHRYYGGGGYYGYRPYYYDYGPRWNVYVPIIPALPFGYSTVWVEGNPYYYADNVYYERVPSGYRVVQAPSSNEVTIEEAPRTEPQGAPQASQAPAKNGSGPVPSYVQPAATAAVDSNKLYAYPRNGQNPTQATFDRIECERWASGQTGFNPTQSREDAQRRADYQRATGACLEGRGYTVK